MFGDERSLPRGLSRRGRVLEIAAATTPGMGVLAGRDYAIRTCFEHLDRVGAREFRGRFGDLDAHQLAGKTVANEDDATVGQSTNAPASGGTLDSHRCRRIAQWLATHRCSLLKLGFRAK